MSQKTKVSIKLKPFISDLRNGVDDATLIKRHNLTESMLPKVIEQLLAAGHIQEQDLASRNMLDTTQKVADLFSFPYGPDGKD